MSRIYIPSLLLLYQPQHVASMWCNEVAAGGPVRRKEEAAAAAGAAPLSKDSFQKSHTVLPCKLWSRGHSPICSAWGVGRGKESGSEGRSRGTSPGAATKEVDGKQLPLRPEKACALAQGHQYVGCGAA